MPVAHVHGLDGHYRIAGAGGGRAARHAAFPEDPSAWNRGVIDFDTSHGRVIR
jgi:hypothetical protein